MLEKMQEKSRDKKLPQLLLFVLLCLLLVWGMVIKSQTSQFSHFYNYHQGKRAFKQQDNQKATTYLLKSLQYKDSDKMMIQIANQAYENENYALSAQSYAPYAKHYKERYHYSLGRYQYEQGFYEAAITNFLAVRSFHDSETYLRKSRHAWVETRINEQAYEQAIPQLLILKDIKAYDALREIAKSNPELVKNNKDINQAIEALNKAQETMQDEEQYDELLFEQALLLFIQKDFEQAYELFEKLPLEYQRQDISVRNKIKGIKAYQNAQYLEGTYQTRQGIQTMRILDGTNMAPQIETLQIAKSYLEVTIEINDDGSLMLTGEGMIYLNESKTQAKEKQKAIRFTQKYFDETMLPLCYQDESLSVYDSEQGLTLILDETMHYLDYEFEHNYYTEYTFTK